MKEKFYSLWSKATDANGVDHYVTVVGKVEQERVRETLTTDTMVEDEHGKKHEATILTDIKYKRRVFTMARSICSPEDTFNFEQGVKIAKKRIKNGDIIGEFTSNNITMLNDDMCNLLIFNEVNHVVRNIDKYIQKKN